MKEKLPAVPEDKELQKQTLEELRRRAARDALSGLLNRATVERCIRERLQAMAPQETCALFIIDLDDFKQVNDTLGHQAGDQAIRRTGQILSSIFRASDIVGRLGGDEFVAFLCGAPGEELVRRRAAEICEKLHLVLGDREVVNLTASVGAYLSAKGQSFEGLYQAADLALYKAKKAGKNRFCMKNRGGYQNEPEEVFRPVNAISLSNLLEKMDSGVALLEMGSTPQVIYVSASYCRILGVDMGALALPKALSELIHPDDLAALEQALRNALEKKTPAEHVHRISADGGRSWHWWHIRGIRMEYDNPNPVMLITAVDVSGFKDTERRQEEQIRQLRTALDQTSKRMWEVDLRTGRFCAYTRDGKYRELGEGKTPFPDNLIEGGWVHPNSVARFRTFARELLGGRAQDFGNFAVRSKDTGYYSWVSVSYRTLFDDVGRAVRAVGVLEELPRGLGGQGGWPPDQHPMPEELVADLIVRMRANLDLDTVELLWIEGTDLSGQVQETRCSQILQLERQKIFCRGEQTEFPDHFDRERLLALYRAGQHWLCAEYRRVDGSGNIRWVRHVLYLAEDPVSRQIYLFVYLLRLDPDRRLEYAIQRGARRDAVTRLFDRETVRQMAETLFSDRRGGNRAVAVLQVNGLMGQGEYAGQDTERLRYAVAAALALALGGGCVLGQYSAHQFLIVIPSVTEKEELRRRMEETIAFLRCVLAAEPGADALRFVAGISLLPAAAAVYSAMLSRAVRAGAFWWNAAADTVAFAEGAEDWAWSHLPPEQGDRVNVRTVNAAQPLSESEKNVALDCVSAMLTARTLDASLQGVLRTVGEYYRADRVYTMMLVENRHALVMTFEWTGAGKCSIQQVVSGTQMERFPLLKKCMEERAPVFLSRQEPIDLDGGEKEKRPWYFSAFPLIREREVEGFLCIENAREHPEDAALFGTLIPFMVMQRERFNTEERPTGTMEQLMGLPDLRAYTQTVYTLTSEYYTSMGAVCIDIPNFGAVNSSHGFEYGSKMLWYTAKTLTDLFGGALLFRTGEAEFIVFYPNTTREVFLGRCGRLRSILQRRYPKQVRIGRAWAEGVFSGKRLTVEAKAAMRAEAAALAGEEPFPLQPEDYSSVAEATRAGRFVLYYQPQIDMRTGALAGAEALVRAVADDGSVAMPARFIEFLEEDGSIRDLDLYVLEQALAQAERWRAAGYGTPSLAVNISRITLAHPSTLASLLAIQSRFPGIPAEALELEVTERGDRIKTDEFREIVDRFRACGLHISLDDFGSQYANLSLFTNVKFETVKLDRSLIAELGANPINRALVRDLVQICRAYGMTCVAEGVETEEQVAALRDMGCIYAQGFYYGRPVPAEEFEKTYLRNAAEQKTISKEERI